MSLITIESLPGVDGRSDREEVIELAMTADERRRVRRRLRAPDGREFALALPTGTRLQPGQVIYREPGRVYVVTAAPEHVIVLRLRNMEEAVKAGHVVGNLHRNIDFSEGAVTVLWDEPLEDRLRREGFSFQRDLRPFHGNPAGEHSH